MATDDTYVTYVAYVSSVAIHSRARFFEPVFILSVIGIMAAFVQSQPLAACEAMASGSFDPVPTAGLPLQIASAGYGRAELLPPPWKKHHSTVTVWTGGKMIPSIDASIAIQEKLSVLEFGPFPALAGMVRELSSHNLARHDVANFQKYSPAEWRVRSELPESENLGRLP